MNNNWQLRTTALLGEDSTHILAGSRVAVLGLGGVGGAAAEALVRAGVGNLLLVDKDCFDITNLNRQILCDREQVGKAKTTAAKERFALINPNAQIYTAQEFFLPENSSFLFDFKPDFVVDAIDTVTAKLYLAKECKQRNIPLLCCLGTGNRLDPSKLTYADISKTSGCPLARVMRRELRKLGIDKLDVVFSTEQPIKAVADSEHGKNSPGSSPFVPPAAGLLMASLTVKYLIENKKA
ncbi:MAG: tRNA threonylcarbamoyladenosine dehydratase [Oscillospiraceae bacterium]|nr:tRNA threonylcarbamoyladenosine dehydratase [Oscillospiraceae bacterium]